MSTVNLTAAILLDALNTLTCLFGATLLVQLLALGGACHIAVVSRKKGWWLLAAGTALIMTRRGFDLNAEQGAYIIAIHASATLVGIALIFRAYTEEIDGLVELANSVPNMVAITDGKGEPLFLNQRWRSYTGLSIASMSNRGWASVIHPDNLQGVIKAWDHSLETGSPFEMDIQFRGEDGQYRWFLSRAFPIRGKRGVIVRWYASNTDIHERKEGTLWLDRKSAEVNAGRKTCKA